MHLPGLVQLAAARPDEWVAKLLANDADVNGSVDTESDAVASHLHDQEGDAVADTDLFTSFPAEDQHGFLLPEWG
jgi:hypothetical protein